MILNLIDIDILNFLVIVTLQKTSYYRHWYICIYLILNNKMLTLVHYAGMKVATRSIAEKINNHAALVGYMYMYVLFFLQC